MCAAHIIDVGLNEHHLIGLLLCRDAMNCGFPETGPVTADAIAALPDVLMLYAELPFSEMPSSMFLNTLNVLQMSWVAQMYSKQNVADAQWGAVELFLQMLFIRAGTLLANVEEGAEVFVNIDATCEIVDGGKNGFTRATVRYVLDVFVVCFRHLDLYRRYKDVTLTDAEVGELNCLSVNVFRKHAFEATKEMFYSFSMHYDLPVAARLGYMNKFSGMYNDVSQVVHFHNESYERRRAPRQKKDVSGPLDEIAVLNHMYPHVPVVMEDELPPGGKPHWLLLPGRVYFVNANGVPFLGTSAVEMFLVNNR